MPRLAYSQYKEWGLRFNGSSQQARTTSTLNLTAYNKITVTAWVKMHTKTAAYQCVLEHGQTTPGNGFYLFKPPVSDNNGRLYGGIQGIAEWALDSNRIGKWNFVAFTLDLTVAKESAVRGFLNGVANGFSRSTTANPSGNFGNLNLNFGFRNGTGLYSNMTMKDVRIYGSLLSEAQIAAMYKNGPNAAFGSPIAQYKMDEGTGASLTDSIGAINAPITGRTTTGTGPEPMWVIDPVRPPRRKRSGQTTCVYSANGNGFGTIPHNAAYNFGSGNFTIEMKVRVDRLNNTYQLLFNKWLSPNQGFLLYNWESLAGTINRFFFIIRSGGTPYATVTARNSNFREWAHIIISVDRSLQENFKMFLNGVHDPLYINSTAYSTVGSISNSETIHLLQNSASGQRCVGGIYDLRLYNRALSDDECLQRYYEDKDITDGLVGKWRMNEGSSTTIADSSNTANNGSVSAITWLSDTMDKLRAQASGRVQTSGRSQIT